MFRGLGGLGVVGMIALLFAITPPASATARAMDVCYDCGSGCQHPAYHDDDAQGSSFTTAAAHTGYCHHSKCADAHLFNCAEADVNTDMAMIEQAASEGQFGLLALLISLDSSQISYAPDRNAVQVSGCKGGIVASFPLAEDARHVLLALTSQ